MVVDRLKIRNTFACRWTFSNQDFVGKKGTMLSQQKLGLFTLNIPFHNTFKVVKKINMELYFPSLLFQLWLVLHTLQPISQNFTYQHKSFLK